MNEEVEKIKESIYGFLEKKGIESESQYFILLSMTRELVDVVLEAEDEEELHEEDEDEFEDFGEEKPEEPEEPTPPKAKSGHGLEMKKLLQKKAATEKNAKPA